MSEGLHERVGALDWYHTLELEPGLETPGWFDLRTVPDGIGMPASTSGLRCLDVGTFDGFWAYEMERRGSDDVVAIDVLDPAGWDWPAGSEQETVGAIGKRKARGAGFELAHEALGSAVERLELNVYDLDPAVHGEFDLIYLGSILLHLRDPVIALERVASVCRGTLLSVDAYDPLLERLGRGRALATLDGEGRPWWWKPNVAGLVRMVEAGGFELDGSPKRLRLPRGAGQPIPPVRLSTLRSHQSRSAVFSARIGDPHVVVKARPLR